MPSVLGLKPDDINSLEKRANYTICVIGCGQRGIQFAIAFAEAGFKVICTDEDQNLLRLLAKGKIPYFGREMEKRINSNIKRGKIKTESEIKTAASNSDVVILTISPKINTRNKLSFSKIERSCKRVGEVLNQGLLFIYGGIASLGYLENNIKEILENASGLKSTKDFGLVYSPIQFENNQFSELFINHKLTLAGSDKSTLNSANLIFQTIMKNDIDLVVDFKKLEAAVLFSIIKNDVYLAFANEMAMFCEKTNLDYFEVIKIVEKHKPLDLQRIGITKEKKNKFFMFLENEDNNSTNVKLSSTARKINEGLTIYSTKLAQKALRACGKTLRRTKISVFGSIKPKSGAAEFIKLLEKKGAKTSIYDPFCPKGYLKEDTKIFKKNLNEAVEGTDCLIILNAHKKIDKLNFKKLSARMKMPAAIIDLVGVIERKKAEKEGFTFNGLGRGSKN